MFDFFFGLCVCLSSAERRIIAHTCKILEAEKNAQSGVRRFFQPIPQKNAV